jgi:hypothetical protein
LCGAVLLAVIALAALISLCTLRGVGAGMPPVAFCLFVIVPHGLALTMALIGGILWMMKSFRVPAQ